MQQGLQGLVQFRPGRQRCATGAIADQFDYREQAAAAAHVADEAVARLHLPDALEHRGAQAA